MLVPLLHVEYLDEEDVGHLKPGNTHQMVVGCF